MSISRIFLLIFPILGSICIQAIPTYQDFYQEAVQDKDYAISARQYLHQHPERYLVEFETSQFIKDQLTAMGVNFTDGWAVNTIDPNQPKGGTGIVAQIGTGHSPCIGLRADFDALPLQEDVDIPFKSTHPNMMHACGHDVHAAMLLGAAKIMKEHESEMKGTVKFFFQPGEEGGAGGKFMVDEGCQTQYPPVESVFGFHVSASDPTGVVTTTIGSSHAAADDFVITVKGKGGHAAMHHMTIDPMTAAMAIVRNLYDIYAREMYFQIETAGIISVTYVQGGEGATNVIPDEVKIGGTMRAPKTKTLDYIRQRVYQTAKEIAHSYRCEAEIKRTMITPYKALENAEHLVKWAQEIFDGQLPYGTVKTQPGSMGGEDFAFFADEVPGAFLRLGCGSGAEIEGHPATNFPHHHSSFAVDERIIPQGVAMHCHIAFQSFEAMNKSEETTDNQDHGWEM